MWAVPGGEWKRSQGPSSRSSSSTIATLARHHEEVLLRVLPVVAAETLAGLQHADVHAELGEALLPLEVAIDAEPLPPPPADLSRVDDEPAVAVRREAELRLP
jgi:hypothetical protein